MKIKYCLINGEVRDGVPFETLKQDCLNGDVEHGIIILIDDVAVTVDAVDGLVFGSDSKALKQIRNETQITIRWARFLWGATIAVFLVWGVLAVLKHFNILNL